ncbi:Late secretory pathway protein AVL9-like protein [Penaeus vannamei]|uniref:Late secretory pathway protein AVL9-like protein n=1 Tax=Penaeus vannamei TaxID=6689 RepID=A0A423TLK3_PENVA|nr:Late secretory pathway protein AVL9-like protein [Penaeus vannamei]
MYLSHQRLGCRWVRSNSPQSQKLPLSPSRPPEKFASLISSDCGLPLEIFTKGNLLHPYLSLQYLDVLTAPTSRAFLLDEGKIEIPDPELKRQLSLSTEDLRFAENIVRQVEAVSATLNTKAPNDISPISNHPDVFLEGVGWVGGEEWLRYQFKRVLVNMRSSTAALLPLGKGVIIQGVDCIWHLPNLMELMPGTYAGNLSMTDMRIRLSHTIQGLDKRKTDKPDTCHNRHSSCKNQGGCCQQQQRWSGDESFTDAAIEATESQANAEKPKEGDTGQE